MKINLINNKSYYSNEYISQNKTNNKDKINFKAYKGCDKRVLANLSEEEAVILAGYVEELKNAQFCDFKIVQHPDCDITRSLTPVVSLKILPSADLYSYTGKQTSYNRGLVHSWGVGEHKVDGSIWLDSPIYDCREIKACHSKAENYNQRNLYHLKEQKGIDPNDVYRDIKDKHSGDIDIFNKGYNLDLIEGLILVDAIETYSKMLDKAKKSTNEILAGL